MNMEVLVAWAVGLITLGGLFAAVESAVGALAKADLERLAEGARFSGAIKRIASDSRSHVNALSFLRVFSETTAAVLVAYALASLTAQLWQALILSALAMSVVSFVLVGVSPRAVGHARAERVVRLSAPLARAARLALGPLPGVLVEIANRVTPGRVRPGEVLSERELLSVIDEAAASDVLEEDDRRLIRSVLAFDDTVARAVMVPRTDMETLESTASVRRALERFVETGYSRIPVVVDDDIDQVSSVLYLRDVARRALAGDLEQVTVADLARPAAFVPESIRLDALLRLMQAESVHIALVVDEYGGIAGLVTLEDVLEELVGDISDEHDRDVNDIEPLADGSYRLSARVNLTDAGELFGITLADDDVDTIGGLITKCLGRLPKPGDIALHHGLQLEADRVGRRRTLLSVIVGRAVRTNNEEGSLDSASPEPEAPAS